MSVKIIQTTNINDLEKLINDFLCSKVGINVSDIKYQVAVCNSGDHRYSAMIIYTINIF